MRRPATLAVLLVLALTFAGAERFRREFNQDGTLPFGIQIEESRSWVGLAMVKLKVSTLTAEDGKLVGTYKIQIPLSSKNNDFGEITLELPENFLSLDSEGGKLVGFATSSKEGEPPCRIVCDVFPGDDREIHLAITTSERTIKFKSNYEVVIDES